LLARDLLAADELLLLLLLVMLVTLPLPLLLPELPLLLLPDDRLDADLSPLRRGPGDTTRG